ncbi:hypothetical protein AB852_00845 [Streptomyces uncialis]|uniref:Metallo-beta-lactamase domain-containing protein n=2 Tax=Streptomyces uncialis TaxID=1048205 RepID=A0A1Q4VCF8_9ACTN|nr:hypothetical protein AB852_00845 [Streptomyces uncialis]
MTPEEGVRAHRDLQGGDAAAGVMLPIHWATFNLAPHPWAEPGEDTLGAAARIGARVASPAPGEPFEPGAAVPGTPWWRASSQRPAGDPTAPTTADGKVRDGELMPSMDDAQ